MEEVFSSKFERLIDLNLEIIRYLLSELQIRTEVVLLSELGIETRGDLLLIDICRKKGCLHFLVQDSARKYLNLDLFREAGIQVNTHMLESAAFDVVKPPSQSLELQHSLSTLSQGHPCLSF